MDGHKLERFKRGGAVVLPSLFTLGNMACGYFAMLAAADGQFARAAWLIFGGMVLDGLDGKVARLVHGESAFGVQFDSLADFLAFGVAPAFVLYELQLQDLPFWGGLAAFFYALCAGLRLARFNVQAAQHAKDEAPSTHFTGLPSPAGAGVLASFVLLYDVVETGRAGRAPALLLELLPYVYGVFPLVMTTVALMMVSKIPYRAFKQSLRPNSLAILLLGVAAAGILFSYPQTGLFLLFSTYLLVGPALWTYRTALRRKA
jgi:CDP-diacylglycerol---serine O-phosphatidyltransferase